MNDGYELPVTALHTNDGYERPVKVFNVDVEYNTIKGVTDTKVEPKEVPSGYTNTKINIIIIATTVVISTCICVPFYFVIAKNCSSSNDNVTTDATTPLLPSECPGGWIKYNESCYHVGRWIYMSFYDAVVFCGQYDAVVVEIESAEENKFIKDDLFKFPAHYWIGLTDAINETFWRWYDSNDYVTFQDWAREQYEGVHVFVIHLKRKRNGN